MNDFYCQIHGKLMRDSYYEYPNKSKINPGLKRECKQCRHARGCITPPLGTPEHKVYQKMMNDKMRDELSDAYVASILMSGKYKGFTREEIPLSIIKMKRASLLISREQKGQITLKKELLDLQHTNIVSTCKKCGPLRIDQCYKYVGPKSVDYYACKACKKQYAHKSNPLATITLWNREQIRQRLSKKRNWDATIYPITTEDSDHALIASQLIRRTKRFFLKDLEFYTLYTWEIPEPIIIIKKYLTSITETFKHWR